MAKKILQKPLNSFFLYRKSKKEEIVQKYKIKKSHEISRKAAELWAKEKAKVRDYFQQISLHEHDKFKELHPDYDWQPWVEKSRKSKYNKPSRILPISPIISPILKPGSIVPLGVSLDVFEAALLDSEQWKLTTDKLNYALEDDFEPMLSPSSADDIVLSF
ncbi:hypothetical protein HDV01_006069 [Terramyces sp. JEL0728]|nr:hypothetical protein HDV01_006069 [Terramyces sp. JEL0728]